MVKVDCSNFLQVVKGILNWTNSRVECWGTEELSEKNQTDAVAEIV